MKNFKLLTILIFAFIVVTSCNKKGDPGPAGPAGNTGPKGEQGDPGTSNIMYSDWFLYDPTYITQNFSFISMEVPVPQLTDEFINNGGTVLVFFGSKPEDQTSVTGIKPLPTWGKEGYQNVPDPNAVYFELDYTYNKSLLNISFIVTQNLSKLTDRYYFFTNVFKPDNIRFRYVLIPGGVKINQRVDQIDLKNYQEVKSYYHLPE
ncbi:MAG: collagen-like protein [Sporocytophaga sp.]|nr:collagen-like protein [Sporocytophaga sp.]